MIKGVLSFKPLADGQVQIMIKGGAGDIPELARLYGKEVQISLAVERATVQILDAFLSNIESKAEIIADEIREYRANAEANPTQTNQVQD